MVLTATVYCHGLCSEQCCLSVQYIWNDDSLSCDHCDLQDVDRLTALLLDSFVKISMIKYPGAALKEDKVVKVKNAVIEGAGLLAHTFDQYYFEHIHHLLDEACKHAKRGISTLSSSVSISARTAQATAVFTEAERRQIARLIIRRFDTNHCYHCDMMFCGSSCQFAVYACGNVGCMERMSVKWMSSHDNVCPFKIVPCSSYCGEFMMRNQVTHHLANECVLRPVSCGYHSIGCTNRE